MKAAVACWKASLDINFKAAGVSVALYKTKLPSFLEPGKYPTEMLSRDPGGKELIQTSATEAALSTLKEG